MSTMLKDDFNDDDDDDGDSDGDGNGCGNGNDNSNDYGVSGVYGMSIIKIIGAV